MSRFGNFEVADFVLENENKAALKKTLGHIKIVKEFLATKGEIRELWFIPKEELDTLLAGFFINVRTKDGSEYEPTSLRGMLGSIERHLKRHNYTHSVIRDFDKTKSALTAKQKQLKCLGKGSKTRTAAPLTGHDIDQLYDRHQLGTSTPSSIVNTMWYNNMMYFGMRAATEHRSMMWGDVQLKYDTEQKAEYIEFHERATKTRTGLNITESRVCPPRMYSTTDNLERCPVNAYKFYAARRPEDYCGTEDPFYIAPVTNNATPSIDQKWFLRAPIGCNKLDRMMKDMAKNAEIASGDRMITNTSVRKTLVQRMTDCNVPDNLQVYVTGHKRPESLNNYRQLGNCHKRQISSLLTSNSATTTGSQLSVAQFPLPVATCNYSNTVESRTTGTNETGRVASSCATYTASSVPNPSESMFSNSTINGNVTVNFVNNYGQEKRRRIRVIESDTDSSQGSK